MFVSCTVFVLSGRGLCDGSIPPPEESYGVWCVLECDQMKSQKPTYVYCEQVGRRGKDYKNLSSLHNQPANYWKIYKGSSHCESEYSLKYLRRTTCFVLAAITQRQEA
jgi:hypothetical protein